MIASSGVNWIGTDLKSRSVGASMRTRVLATFVALALSLAPVSPAFAADPPGAAVEYRAATRVLSLPLQGGGVPTIEEFRSPPRFVVVIPGGAAVPAGETAYEGGLGSAMTVPRTVAGARVELALRRPLNGGYQAAVVRGRLELTLTPIGLAHVATPRPRPTPRPTPKPTAKPTPRPTPDRKSTRLNSSHSSIS